MDSVSINIFEQINQICKDFRRECRNGAGPDIAEWLQRVPESSQPNLLQNLLDAEINYRRSRGQAPTSEEYIKLFPQFTRLIRQAFYEDTMMSIVNPLENTPAIDQKNLPSPDTSFDSLAHHQAAYAPMEMPAARRIGDYELIRELGRGGMGVVYEAKHLQRQNHVALKTLPTGVDGQEVNAERLHKFRREFRSLSEINHPNLVGMQTLEVDGGQWFFTMDLIDGTDFFNDVRPNGKLHLERLRELLPQLARGILALHERKIVHRDVKPTNVMVTHDGRVAILDFGLVAELEQQTGQGESLKTQHFAGTPRYAAPEQITGKRNEASDWYAVGVMMYEALTGVSPITGSAMEILQKKQNEDPPKLASRTDLPTDLAELIDGLLIRDPRQRLDGAEISKLLSLATDSTMSAVTLERNLSQEPITQELKLIGRNEQLSKLKQFHQQLLADHEPAVVFISGRSGEGKSSLAEKFLIPVRQGTEVLVLSGRCYDRESIPFKAIDCIIDSLVSYLRGRKSETVAKLLPEDTVMLAHLFPLLKRVDAIDEISRVSISQLDGKQIRYRAFNAMRELLARIGQTTPIVMFIDDLQWGDVDSADVLFQMLTSNDKPAILFIGSYRSDEADDSPFLQQWEKLCNSTECAIVSENIVVGPLSEEQCVSIVTARLERDDDSIREQVLQMYPNTGGNPYFIEQLIHSFDPQTGRFNPRPLAEVIDRRLDRLSDKALPLLKAICIAGQSASVEEVSQVAGFQAPPYSTLNHMRKEQLIRSIGSEDFRVIDTYHDKIRETVLNGLSDQEFRQLHQVYGGNLEASENLDVNQMLAAIEQGAKETKTPTRVFDLTYHYERAGDNAKLLLYSILAAEHAVNQYALPLALDHYRTANRLMENRSKLLQFRILLGQGNVLMLTGQYEQANQTLDQAVSVAPNLLSEIKAKLLKADIIYKTGSLTDATTACARLLKQLGCPVPVTQFGKTLSAGKHRLRRWLHEMGWIKYADSNPEKTLLEIGVLVQIAYPCLFYDGDTALWATSIGDDKAILSGESRARIQTAAMRLSAIGWFKQDIEQMEYYSSVSRSKAKKLNDRYGKAMLALNFGGAIFVAAGRFDRAAGESAFAVRQFEELGDVWRATMAKFSLLNAQLRMGEIEKGMDNFCDGFAVTVKLRQPRLAMFFLSCWLQLTDNSFPMRRVLEILEPVWDDTLSACLLKKGMANWYLIKGDTQHAIREAQESIELAKAYQPYCGGACESFVVYAHALRVRASDFPVGDKRLRQQAERQAMKAAKRAVHFSSKSTYDLPYALRELSLNFVAANNYRKAYRMITESCDVAQRQSAAYELAQSSLVQAQIAEKLGLPNAGQQIEVAESQLANFKKRIRDATVESVQFLQRQGLLPTVDEFE